MKRMSTNTNRDSKFNTFEKSYKKVKHVIVGLFSVGLLMSMIGFIGTVIYFNHLTHESSQISDSELQQKVLHFAGDDLINHN
ncbi:transglycosylase, partial [Staphylococcus borealis]